jgi:hypothetical protein
MVQLIPWGEVMKIRYSSIAVAMLGAVLWIGTALAQAPEEQAAEPQGSPIWLGVASGALAVLIVNLRRSYKNRKK